MKLKVTDGLDRSNIEWTGPTWNPWQGCQRVSPGCAHCYMFRDMPRYGKDPSDIHRSAVGTFNKPLKWQRECDAGKRMGTDRLVFTCSWSDWFIEQADAWRSDAWDIVRRTPGLIYQILTKRHDRIADHLPSFWDEIKQRVWMGVSVENQRQLHRLESLVEIDAGVRFLSIEPLLSDIDLVIDGDFSQWSCRECGSRNVDTEVWVGPDDVGTYQCHECGYMGGGEDADWTARFEWAIGGVESMLGHRAGRFQDGYDSAIKSIISQCAESRVAFFHKQMPINGRVSGNPAEWPEWARVRQWPKGWEWLETEKTK